MGPQEYFNNKEMEQLIGRVGEIILDASATEKRVPPTFETGLLMLKTAHSYLADRLSPPTS